MLDENDSEYCRVLPHLGFLRGTGWEPKHWHQLFTLLGLRMKTKQDVTLGDLLGKADAIATSIDKIKQLNAQAQNEAVIRKALDELDLWGYERSFMLTEAQDFRGTKVCCKGVLACYVFIHCLDS